MMTVKVAELPQAPARDRADLWGRGMGTKGL